MNDRTECGDVTELLAEVATGAASGTDRAQVLRHLTTCDNCRQELESLAKVADDVLLVAPAHETPAGFEGAVLARLSEEDGARDDRDRNRRWWTRAWSRRRTVLAVAAVAVLFAAVGATVVWQATGDDRDLAASYRDTLDVADGRYFSAAPLVGPDGAAGTVFVYDGDPSWLFVIVEDAPAGEYDMVVTAGGRTHAIGTCTVTADGGCSAGATLGVSVRELHDVSLVAPDGTRLHATPGSSTDTGW